MSDIDWLVEKSYMDEGLLYKLARVAVRRELIVGFRILVPARKRQIN